MTTKMEVKEVYLALITGMGPDILETTHKMLAEPLGNIPPDRTEEILDIVKNCNIAITNEALILIEVARTIAQEFNREVRYEETD